MIEPIEIDSTELRRVWNQKAIPVVIRRTGARERLRVRLPYDSENRNWLQNDRRTSPEWIGDRRFWELPKSWFNDFVNRALERYGRVYVIQPYIEQEKCAPACMNALGHECECSCMGRNHGAGNDGSWFEVNEAFATRSSGEHVACRLLVRKVGTS